jgi:hypothetical protein
MVKIISQGLLPRDHPMFTGEIETFSVRKPNQYFTRLLPEMTSEQIKENLIDALEMRDISVHSARENHDYRLEQRAIQVSVR